MNKHNKPNFIPYEPYDPKAPERASLEIPESLSPLTLRKLLLYTSSWHKTSGLNYPNFHFDTRRLDFYQMEDDPYGMFPMYFHMISSMLEADYNVETGRIRPEPKKVTFSRSDLLFILRAVEYANLKLGDNDYEERLIGLSPQMFGVFGAIDRVAPSDMPVLIMGETGTGKELVARAIWRKWASNEPKRPFVPINCAALPSEIIESELFGHAKGAFSGAIIEKKGIFEEAGNGVVFLDEIGEMPPLMQVKLLRALNERKFKRVGENKERVFHARVIAATNRPLNDSSERENPKPGRPIFREDLYFRLAGASVTLPSLRERILDLPILIYYHAKRVSKDMPIDFLPQYLMHFIFHDWTGNIRELKNIISEAQLSSSAIDERDVIALKWILEAGGLVKTEFGEWLRINIRKEATQTYKNDYYQRPYFGDIEQIKYLRSFFPEGAYSIDEEFLAKFDSAIEKSTIQSAEEREKLFQALLYQWRHHRYQRSLDSSNKAFETSLGITGALEKKWVWEKYLTHPRGGGTGAIYDKWAGRDNNLSDSTIHPLLRYGILGIAKLIQEEYETDPWPDIARRIDNKAEEKELGKTNEACYEDKKDELADMPVKAKDARKWLMQEIWLPEMEKRFKKDSDLKKETKIDPDTLKEYRKKHRNKSDEAE